MKSISDVAYALRGWAAVALLAGCGNPAGILNPGAQTPLSNAHIVGPAVEDYAAPRGMGFDSKTAERLTAPYVYESCMYHYQGTDSWYSCTYSTNGTATGPYPGTFTASGTFGGGKSGRVVSWFLSELFTITSGTSTAEGKINADGGQSESPPIPGIFRYKILHRHGKENAKIEALQSNDFSETLRRL